MQKALLLLTLIPFLNHVDAQKISWLTWDEAIELQKVTPKKVMVNVVTDWCGVCKKMDKTTYENQELVDFITENFYLIRFNAEEKKPIEINGRTYKQQAFGKRYFNELAYDITYGKLMFPTIVFLDDDFRIIQPIEGYIGPERLLKMATYFAKNYHKTTPWHDFNTAYQSSRLSKMPVKN